MPRPRLSEEPSVRLQMVMPPALLKNVTAWQHDNRVASLSEAIRTLVESALKAEFIKGL
jgi:hypothetical protein